MNEIIQMLIAGRLDQASNEINKLSNTQRIELRIELESLKLPTPRNLYYNYTEQQWI